MTIIKMTQLKQGENMPLNVFEQLQTRLSANLDGVYKNKKGVEFRVVDKDPESMYFSASSVISADGLSGYRHLKIEMHIFPCTEVFLDVENICVTDLREEFDNCYQASNDVFRFSCFIGELETSLISNPNVAFYSNDFLSLNAMIDYTTEDFLIEYNESFQEAA